MASSPERRELVSRTEARIAALQTSLHQVQTTRRRLGQSSAQVRSDIQSVISRQLESLRSREVWLLDQVSVLEQARSGVLRDQEDALNWALGTLTASLGYQEIEEDGLVVDHQLQLNLDRLSEVELRPLESSMLTFHADVEKLRSAIHEFGRVDSPRGGLEGRFPPTPGDRPSPSLPHAFEDYGDAEHHVLYKTLEDIKQENSINVSIPRLSKPAADWLTWSADATPTPPEATPTTTTTSHFSFNQGSQFSFPPFHTAGSSAGNIREWLASIKYETETEDEEFEVIEPSFSTRVISSSSSMEMLHQFDDILTYFSTVRSTPSDQWLLHSVGTATEQPLERLAYFQEAMRSSREWLVDYPQQPGACGPTCGGQVPDRSALDIENLHTLYCVEPPTSKMADNDDEKEVDECELVMGVCRANEPCTTFNECLCDMNCGSNAASRHTSPKHEIKAWLIEGVGQQVEESKLFSYFTTLPRLTPHWLLTQASSTGMAVDEASGVQFPAFTQPWTTESWLLTKPDIHEECLDNQPSNQSDNQPSNPHDNLPSNHHDNLPSNHLDNLDGDFSTWLMPKTTHDNQCIDNPDCSTSTIGYDEWLSPSKSSGQNYFEEKIENQWLFSQSQKIPHQTDMSAWVCSSDIDEEEEEKNVIFSLFQENKESDLWLKSSEEKREKDENGGEEEKKIREEFAEAFSRITLGDGPWLKPIDSYTKMPEYEEKEKQVKEGEMSEWLVRKEGEKASKYDEGLFACFHDNQMEKWLGSSPSMLV